MSRKITIGKNITAIKASTFSGCKKLKTVTIGSGVKEIEKKAFYECPELKTVKYSGTQLTIIGSYAFYNCAKLTTFPAIPKLQKIDDYAFCGCKALKSITLSSKITKIGEEAFLNCAKLSSITIKTTKLTGKAVGSKAFAGTPKKPTVKVPKDKKKAYKELLIKKGLSEKASIKN